MDSDLGLQLIAARNSTTQANLQTALVKRSAQSDAAVVDMIAQVQTLPPPAGQGTRVDKFA